MRTALALCAGLAFAGVIAASPALAAPASVAAALADPGRPPQDAARDASRKPAELIALAGVKRGDRIIDFIPGGGYFTRIFSGVVGPTGHVYALVPSAAQAMEAKDSATITSFSASHPNVSLVIAPPSDLRAPGGPVDVFWTAQNYHDLYNPVSPTAGPPDLLAFNKAVFAALKPGGVYIVIDHAAPDGSGVADTKTLHRIDAEVVKRDVVAAGFVFEGQSDVLRNPADPRTVLVFDPSIRGKTDQFVFKFRKPQS